MSRGSSLEDKLHHLPRLQELQDTSPDAALPRERYSLASRPPNDVGEQGHIFPA